MHRTPTVYAAVLSLILYFHCPRLFAEGEAPAGTPPTAMPPTSTTPPPGPTYQKTLWVAFVLRKRSKPAIAVLNVPDIKIPVLLAPRDARLRPLIEMRLEYDRPGWTLYTQNGVQVTPGPKPNTFSVFAFLNGKLNEVALTAKGPKGETENETVYVYAPEAQEFRLLSPWDEILLSVGLSNLVYSQTDFGKFAAFTGIISASYVSPNRTSRYGMAASADLTLVTIKTSPIQRSPQLVEAKLDGTCLLHTDTHRRSHTQLLLGASYLTMISNNSPFGFANLVAPEIGIRNRYLFPSEHALITEFRYVAVGKPFDQRGIDLNVGWSWVLRNLHRAEVGFGFSGYAYKPDASTTIESDLVSLRIGYSI